jgi:MarR family 2-MHQ and catechol resistance regulon transcriptional repressor
MEILPRVEQDDSSTEAWLGIVSAYRAVHVLLNQQLAESGLTFPQYRVIRALGKFGAMPMNKISEHMLVTPANITGLVDRLEGRGYIERVERGTDRRVIRITLTRKGKTLYQRTSVQNRKLVNRIMRVLTNDELLNLAKLLEKIKEASLEESSVRNESN